VSKRGWNKSGEGSWKGMLIAPIIFVIILLSMFLYSGIWPPLVVIESKSMQHSEDTSYIGVIDTGDLVIVKETPDSGRITTYLEGVATGYQTYGEYGDVIIYFKSGLDKPIIHRAICYLEYNQTGGGFDIPVLADVPSAQWEVVCGPDVWWNQKGTIELYDVGYAQATVRLDLSLMLDYFDDRGITPHGGFITMGDNNWSPSGSGPIGNYDQLSIIREPVKEEWVIGVARGEIPWFGLLKLYLTGTAPSYVPSNSETFLIASIVLIVGVPIVLDVSNHLLKKRGINMFGWYDRLMERIFKKKKKEEPQEKRKKTT
jgi:signal peptidase